MKQFLLAALSLLACNAFAGDTPHACKPGQSNYFVSYNFKADTTNGFGNLFFCATPEQMETPDGLIEARKLIIKELNHLPGKKATNSNVVILFFKQMKN